MKTTNRSPLQFSAFFVTAALAASPALAAGSHSGGHGHGHGDGDMTFGEPGKPSEVSRTIEVTAGDNYFEPGEIDIKKGETVRFVIRNEGEFVHEFNIGTAKMHEAHQEEMMMMVEHGVLEPDKINHHMMNMEMEDGHSMAHDDPNSVLLEPGQNGEIIWKFAEAQNLEFACNIPGHYASGMAGNFNFVTKVTQR